MKEDVTKELESGEWIIDESEIRQEYSKNLLECCLKLQRYNSTVMDADDMRTAISDLMGRDCDPTSLVVFPFRCDLGFNIHIGNNVIVNYNCTFLDTATISIGDNCKIGPDCHLVTAIHPKDHLERRKHAVRGAPIEIGEDSWLGANVTVLPGVTIRKRCIIGAGSVVTKDVPDDSIYVGNPAHPI